MKHHPRWRRSLACLSLLFGLSTTTALPVAALTSSRPSSSAAAAPTSPLAQRDDCREATRDLFIFRRPSREPFNSLRQGERVRLAEAEPDREGWIAVQDPTLGFVEARFLRRCGTAIDPSFPGTGLRPGVAELCVNDRAGRDGLSIYNSPNFSARIIERAFEGEALRVNTRDIRRDPSGFVWFAITFPTNGWVVYGLPNEGLTNLENCDLLRLRGQPIPVPR